MPNEKSQTAMPFNIAREVVPVDIQQERTVSYTRYAMSVIVGRALPDARDGLKPVHRRILYSMRELGFTPASPHKKAAQAIGEVVGKFHPHAPEAVYDALVRMAQDFSMRYPLVKGQGNFGSMDGDGAAAMRYTEAKMTPIAEELLADIEKETVNFRDNFDATEREPVVLPGKLPNVLLNGTLGIAVGMATDLAPHNLTEVTNAIVHLIEKPEATIEDITDIIKGPDFPTGGII